jgi:hypothetical protein
VQQIAHLELEHQREQRQRVFDACYLVRPLVRLYACIVELVGQSFSGVELQLCARVQLLSQLSSAPSSP